MRRSSMRHSVIFNCLWALTVLLSLPLLNKVEAEILHEGALRWGGVGDDRALDIALDHNERIVVTGTVVGAADFNGDRDSLDGGAESAAGFANSDVFISVLTPARVPVWSRRFGGMNWDEAHAVAVDQLGRIVVVGVADQAVDLNSDGDSTDGIAETGAGYGLGDGIVAVFDTDGTFLWAKRLGGTQQDRALGVAIDSANNIVVTGNVIGNADLNGDGDSSDGGAESSVYGDYDVFISVFNSSGVHQWAKRLGGVWQDYGNAITTDSNRRIIVAGSISGAGDLNGDGDFLDGLPESGAGYGGGRDPFVSVFDSSGTHLWAKRFGGTSASDEAIYAVTCDHMNNIIVGGQVFGDADLNGDGDRVDEIEINNLGDTTRAFASVFNASGGALWAKTFSTGSSVASVHSIFVNSLGQYVFSGIANTPDLNADGDFLDGEEVSMLGDIFVTAFDSSGVHHWGKRLGFDSGGTSIERAKVVSTSIGNIVLAGGVRNSADLNGDGDTDDGGAEDSTGYGGDDAFITEFSFYDLELDATASVFTELPVFLGIAGDNAGLSSVQYQVNSTNGAWVNCNAQDGMFDTTSENFTCEIDSLADGFHTIYFRTVDSNGDLLPAPNYVYRTFTLVEDGPLFGLNTQFEGCVSDEIEGHALSVLKTAYTESTIATDYTPISHDKDWRANGVSLNYTFSDGMQFPFYDQFYSSINVSSNGRVCFESVSNEALGELSDTDCGPFIAPFWADLDTTAGDIAVSQDQTGLTIVWDANYNHEIRAVGVTEGGTPQGWTDTDEESYTLPFSFPILDVEVDEATVYPLGGSLYLEKSVGNIEMEIEIKILMDDGEEQLVLDGTGQENEDIYITSGVEEVSFRWQAEDNIGQPVNVEIILYSNGRIRYNFGDNPDELGFEPYIEIDLYYENDDSGQYIEQTYESIYHNRRNLGHLTSMMWSWDDLTESYIENSVASSGESSERVSTTLRLEKDGRIEFSYGGNYDFSLSENPPRVGVSKGDGTLFTEASISKDNFSIDGTQTYRFVPNQLGTITSVEFALDSSSKQRLPCIAQDGRCAGSSMRSQYTWSNCVSGDGAFNEASEDFSCSLNDLPDGIHTVYVRSTDSAGNTTPDGLEARETFFVDCNPVNVDLVPITETSTFPVLTGEANDSHSNVSLVEFQIGSTTGNWTSCNASDGAFDEQTESFTCILGPLDHGTYTVFVRGIDSAFNLTSPGNEVSTIFNVVVPSSFCSLVVQSGIPIADARVSAKGANFTEYTTTDASGEFCFASLPEGTVSITVEKQNIVLLEQTLELTPGENLINPLEIEQVSLNDSVVTFWNGFLGMVNILELLNAADSSSTVLVRLYDLDGMLLSDTEVEVKAKNQTDLVVNDLIGFSDTSYGSVEVVGVSGPVNGRITYYLPHFGSWGSGFDFSFSLPFFNAHKGDSYAIFNSYNPSRNINTQSYLIPTWLTVANLAKKQTYFEIEYYDQEGQSISIIEIAVPPKGRRDIQAGHEFSTCSAVGIVAVRPQQEEASYVATVNRYGRFGEDERYGFGFSVPTRAGNSSLISAPIGSVDGLSVLELANVSDKTNYIHLSWHKQNGMLSHAETKLLEPYAQEHLIVASILKDFELGSITIDGSEAIIAGVAEYYYDNITNEVSTAGYSEALEAFGTSLSGTYNTYLGMSNWLRLINLADKKQNVEIKIGETKETLALEPNQRHDRLILGSSTGSPEYGLFSLRTKEAGTISANVCRVRENSGSYDFMSISPVR